MLDPNQDRLMFCLISKSLQRLSAGCTVLNFKFVAEVSNMGKGEGWGLGD